MVDRGRHHWKPPGRETKVIFRTYPDGEVIALFPEIPEGESGAACSSYMLVGQHGSAACEEIIYETRPSTTREYARIKRELEGIGYTLDVRKRITTAMRVERWAQA